MSKSGDTISAGNSNNNSPPNSNDCKDFPFLRKPAANNSPINVKTLNKGNQRMGKPYKYLFFFENDQEKFDKNLNEEFPKLPNFPFKKGQKSEGVQTVKKEEECSLQNPAGVEKGESVTESQLQTTVTTKNERKKLDSSKKVPAQPRRNPNKKKRSEPIFLNLGEVLELNMSQKKSKQSKKLKSKFQRSNKGEIISGNFLDSSNPKRNRGKHREIKKKKHSKLKVTILKERIIKQKIKEENISDFCDENCMRLINSIDFKLEIGKYLNSLKTQRRARICERDKKRAQDKISSISRSLELLHLNSLNGNLKCDKEKLIKTKVKENCSPLTETEAKDSLPKSCNKVVKFTAKFREYCDNIVTPSLNVAVSELINDLIDLQDRAFARDPIKAKAKKRHVSGFREIKKYLTVKKVKMVVIAPNLEKLQMDGSIYDIIKELKILCSSQSVPCVFALDRHKLGRCTKKNVPISAFAVLNYDGVEDRFQNVVKHLEEAKKEFDEGMNSKKVGDSEDVNTPVMSHLLTAFKEKQQMVEVTREKWF